MTLLDAILHRAKISSTLNFHEKKYASPPPEVNEEKIVHKKKKKFKYAKVHARVDSYSPLYDGRAKYRQASKWTKDLMTLCNENLHLLTLIRKAQLKGGKVDSHWKKEPVHTMQYYKNRVTFLNRIYRDNLDISKRINAMKPRVYTTAELNREWSKNRRIIASRALKKFVLFSTLPYEEIEDPVFLAPPGVKRPRVYMTVGLRDCAVLGELCIELFTEVCPQTCRLFTELLDGDMVGHGYVGTCFFRKVPHLYWSGGDVTYNNGFGCYAQSGRTRPINAENYHFPHSMPGLLSMKVTCDDEVCGIFNITFKPLPQFDLHNVVFGRIIRPSLTYDTTKVLGRPLSSHPLVEVRATRRKVNGRWISGAPNTRLAIEYNYRHGLVNRR